MNAGKITITRTTDGWWFVSHVPASVLGWPGDSSCDTCFKSRDELLAWLPQALDAAEKNVVNAQ